MKKVIIWFVLALLGGFLVLFLISEVYGKMLVVTKKEHEAFFKKLKQGGFTDKYIAEIFADERAKLDLRVLKKGKKVNYFSEEFGLFKPNSIFQGKSFLVNQIIQKAADQFGVEKEIMVSIFRIESNFGHVLGDHRVFNSLYTLFVFKKKIIKGKNSQERNLAEEELINFLLLCRKHNYDSLSISGSWAGAFGLFQFMPSSFLNYAIDGNGDGKIDLFCIEDAAFSAGNYLKGTGWRRGISINKPVSEKHVLYRYNHSLDYCRAVLAYARTISLTLDAA